MCHENVDKGHVFYSKSDWCHLESFFSLSHKWNDDPHVDLNFSANNTSVYIILLTKKLHQNSKITTRTLNDNKSDWESSM